MKPIDRKLATSLVLGGAMALTSALTGALTPTSRLTGHDRFRLDAMVPASFAGWRIDEHVVPLTPDPEQQGVLEKIYDQTLSRTYVNRDGERVMLSIAYGGDQSKALQLHLPEVCYVAQGFQMVNGRPDQLGTRFGTVPVKRLVARLNQRNEPITYWIKIGDKAVLPGIEQKVQRLTYGLSGQIPDGMLVRVSTIDASESQAYRLQDRFVNDMLASMTTRDRMRLLGATPATGGQ